ncbi:hypothetical protein GCM10027598_45700 [Amycolatopsis oliviviridis]|uniref:Uncharacterized protein n=1 Tax=Amycolatopsis oliviviridis TaxID=1471590 RepID=A0ABQ3L8T6_9PSEU|nr:hypothetical protein [Amycolatopsis oliviviridis]GHH08839.1 hypothetical protein GCM10017790_16130 [Amycolatopsis oliviviridis]
MPEDLGPFQGFWNAWDEVHAEICGKAFEHFPRAAEIQFREMREHLDNGDTLAAAREATDVISVALNTLRWLGYGPAEAARIASDRARERMLGQTSSILDKYQSEHDI